MRTAVVLGALLQVFGSNAWADEPLLAPPPADAPPPPVVGAAPPPPALPAGVTAIQDPRTVTFVLTGGNRVVGRRIGEDPEYVWIEAEGRQARVRKSEIASMNFVGTGATPASPPTTFVSPGQAQPPALSYYTPPPPGPRGRGMVIWGGVLVGVGYTGAVIASFDESTGSDGSSILLAIPIVGPFFFAATDAAEEPGVWIVDGLLQVGGVVLLYIGIRRLGEAPERPEQQERGRPQLVWSVSPHRVDAGVRWTL